MKKKTSSTAAGRAVVIPVMSEAYRRFPYKRLVINDIIIPSHNAIRISVLCIELEKVQH